MGLRTLLLSWAEPELATATRLLRQVNEHLDQAWRENIRLKDEREEQARVIQRLTKDNAQLQNEVSRLTAANAHLQKQINEFEKRMATLEGKYDRLMALYFRLQAEAGKDIGLGPAIQG